METTFKSAMNRVHADENLKRKTAEYLMKNETTQSTNKERAKTSFKRIAVAACSVALLGIAAVAVSAYRIPTSYLSLDINPSVELGINTFGKVISAEAYNKDGETILNGQNVINGDVQSAVDTLVKSAAQNGFVAQDGSTVIAVTSETDNSTTASELETAAAQGAEAAVKAEGKTAAVQKDNVALERRDEARKLGITPGKLNLIQKLQTLDPSITVSEYKDAKVTDIMKKFVELKKAVQPDKPNQDSSSPSDSSQDASEVSSKVPAAQPKTSTAQDRRQTGNGAAENKNNPDSAADDSSFSSLPAAGNEKSGIALGGKEKQDNKGADHGKGNAGSNKKQS